MLRSNTKYNCGQIIPSSCVPYTGSDLTVLSINETLDCNANINDVIKVLDAKIKILQDDNDFTTLSPRCLNFTPATITNIALHQMEIDEICAAKAQILALQTQFNDLDIGNQLITVDLGCLASSGAACASGTNTYTIRSLFNLVFNTLCTLLGQS